MIDNSLLVVTYLWDDPKFKFRSKFKYKPEHVMALYRQLKKFLHIPFYFTVVCDEEMLPKMEQWAGNFLYPSSNLRGSIDPNLNRIDCYRIWDECKDMGRCWRRLRGFSAMEFGHLPKVLFIDLDMMILDNITGLIKRNWDHPFVMADDSECRNSKYNGSFVLFTPTPTTHQMWKTFNSDPEACKKFIETRGWQGSDQAWIRYYMDEVAKQPIKTIGEADGLLSFRWHCKDKGIDPFEAGAKMVNFHGPWMPDMPEVNEEFRWTRNYRAFNNHPTPREKTPLKEILTEVERDTRKTASRYFTPQKIKDSCDMLREGASDYDIADFVGCSIHSVSRWMDRLPELAKAKLDGNEFRKKELSAKNIKRLKRIVDSQK